MNEYYLQPKNEKKSYVHCLLHAQNSITQRSFYDWILWSVWIALISKLKAAELIYAIDLILNSNRCFHNSTTVFIMNGQQRIFYRKQANAKYFQWATLRVITSSGSLIVLCRSRRGALDWFWHLQLDYSSFNQLWRKKNNNKMKSIKFIGLKVNWNVHEMCSISCISHCYEPPVIF